MLVLTIEGTIAMKPSSRTPEGQPNRCPVCGKEIRIEPSHPAGDAPCPCCGHLLWFPGCAVRRILIADDDRAEIETLKACLSDIACETMVATHAEEIASCVVRWQPALLLLNHAMPNGFEVCRDIKHDPEKSKTMVLMICDVDNRGDIERAIKAGADDFMGKPVEKPELLMRVRNLLALRVAMDEVRGQ